MELLKKIEGKQAKLGVIGLGYVGLPLAVEFARAGFGVIGYDVDERKVAELMAGRSYIPDVPAEHLAEVVKSGKLRRDDRPEASRPTPTSSTSACRRRCARPRTRT